MNKEISEKIYDKIRKLIRLKESASKIGSEGEANAAAAAVNRLLTEYNLSLMEITEEETAPVLSVAESSRISYQDTYGNIWKRDLLRIISEYNYCQILLYSGTTYMVVLGTKENASVVIALYNYLRSAFKTLATDRHREFIQGKRGYYCTQKFKKNYIRSYLLGCCVGLRAQFESINRTCKETGIILCHKQLIKDYLDTVKLVKRKPLQNKRKTNYLAFNSGYMDGNNINLNKQIDNG